MSEQLFEILPKDVRAVTTRLSRDKITELRLRADKPVLVAYGGKRRYLSAKGLTECADNALTVSGADIENFVYAASEYSIYAVSEDIINGFITACGGVRIGICGTAVAESGKITAVKDFRSIVVRFPHEIIGCGQGVYDIMQSRGRYCALVLSPPGAGKTTMLRDLARLISSGSPPKNVLVVDERDELAVCSGEGLSVGKNADVMRGAFKKYAFENGVRGMCPDVIVTDELYSADDAKCVTEAVGGGVDVIASAHATDINGFLMRDIGKIVTRERLFDIYIELSTRRGVGTVERVLDNNLTEIDYGG